MASSLTLLRGNQATVFKVKYCKGLQITPCCHYSRKPRDVAINRHISILRTNHVTLYRNKHCQSAALITSKGQPDQHDSGQQRNVSRRKWFHYIFYAGALVGILGYKLKRSRVDARSAEDHTVENQSPETGTGISPMATQSDTDGRMRERSLAAPSSKLTLQEAIRISRDLAQRVKDESGSPGLVIAVSVDGDTVWSEGLGYADVENRVPCKPETVLRIASISKSITMAGVAKLWESGYLDLDKPVQFYVPEFPEKTWQGEKVTITTRQLLCHMSGIRHYSKDYMKPTSQGVATKEAKPSQSTASQTSKSKSDVRTSGKGDNSTGEPPSQSADVKVANNQSNVRTGSKDEMQLMEYYIKEKYPSVLKSLDLFKDDPLVHKPGSQFLYTTHGWTLISAVVERAAKLPFEKCLKSVLDDMGMDNTYLEDHAPIIYNRGRHYIKDRNGNLINAHYTDLSYKWAGGGLISNVIDLVKFGNIMLYSYQATVSNSNKGSKPNTVGGDVSGTKGYLKPDTMQEFWSPQEKTKIEWGRIKGGKYGLGWAVWGEEEQHGYCRRQPFFVSHTGGAIGASSVLLIRPSETGDSSKGRPLCSKSDKDFGRPNSKGIVVAIVVNMMSVGLNRAAYDIATVFDKVEI